jgi:hypothetical protein
MPLSGCTIGGKSFSMDSNSRIPFFGLELKERKPKSTAPVYNSISRSASSQLRIERAVNVGNSSIDSSKAIDVSARPVDLQPKDDKRVPIARPTGSSTSKPAGKNVQPQAIPLPRTDNQPGSDDHSKDCLVVDFQ